MGKLPNFKLKVRFFLKEDERLYSGNPGREPLILFAVDGVARQTLLSSH